jgi:hypothetical protein
LPENVKWASPSISSNQQSISNDSRQSAASLLWEEEEARQFRLVEQTLLRLQEEARRFKKEQTLLRLQEEARQFLEVATRAVEKAVRLREDECERTLLAAEDLFEYCRKSDQASISLSSSAGAKVVAWEVKV